MKCSENGQTHYRPKTECWSTEKINKYNVQEVGVSKKTGNRNWKTGKPGSLVLVPVAKKSKTGDPGSGPGFWHLVKTGKPEPGAYIYNNNFLILYIY
jgi:hypothetical protein